LHGLSSILKLHIGVLSSNR